MTRDWLKTLHDAGSAIFDVFLLPGDLILLQFAAQAPELAVRLGIDTNSDVVAQSAVISALIWLLLVGVVWKLFRFLQNVSRRVAAACKAIVFRSLLRMRNFKKELRCRLLNWLPQRRSSSADSNPEVEFDDIDLAVLRNTAAAGGGFVVSAPGLGEQLTLRPAKVQRSLERLRRYRMVEVALGSTDGFDNYRLSPSGAAFLDAIRRSQNRGEPLTATSALE